MRISRVLAVVAAAAGFALSTTQGIAQTKQAYPTKPVRLISGAFASPSDMLARTLGPRLSEIWGQPVVIENRPGGAGTIQAAVVAKATPDGYTLLLISAQFAIGAGLRPSSLPYDPIKDFAGVSQLGYSTVVLAASPALGVKSLKEFISLAKSRPGKIYFSSGGGGSSTHLQTERFNNAADIQAVHVGFKGTSDALLEVFAGRVQYTIGGLSTAMPFIKDGRLLALAVAPHTTALLPGVPSIQDVVPKFSRDGSHGLMAPAGTPMPIRQQISRDVGRVLAMPEVKGLLESLAYIIAPSTPEEHDRIIRADIKSFAEIGKRVGLTEK